MMVARTRSNSSIETDVLSTRFAHIHSSGHLQRENAKSWSLDDCCLEIWLSAFSLQRVLTVARVNGSKVAGRPLHP